MDICVLDPGHGGLRSAGGSTPNQSVGLHGAREKDLALEIALLAKSMAPPDFEVVLTRTSDVNRRLAERIAIARDEKARAFISIHLNGDPSPHRQGTITFVHRDAGSLSMALAEHVQEAVILATGYEDLGVRRAPLAVLDPSWHAADTAACLIELSFLTDPKEERRLREADYRRSVAGRLCEALQAFLGARLPFDVFHQVPLIPQTTGMSCWAAAAAMIIGWRERLAIEPSHVALGSGGLEAYDLGLTPRDVASLGRAFELEIPPPRRYGVSDFKSLLQQHGPLWIGHADPDLHVVVMVGISGDGEPEGTWVSINDPWPMGIGERYQRPFGEWIRCFAAASEVTGLHAQVLYSKPKDTRSA